MRIFIRHGEKAYMNGGSKTFMHDPPLTENGKNDAIYMGHFLQQLYGTPLFIIYSPFLRTRETAKYMQSALVDKVPMYCDVDIAEFLGNQKCEIGLQEETRVHIPNVSNELFYQFKNRIEDHNEKYECFDHIEGAPIWVITHGMVMKQIHHSYNRYKLRRKFPYLSYMIRSSAGLSIHLND